METEKNANGKKIKLENTWLSVLAVDDDHTQLEKLRVFAESIEYPSIEYSACSTAEEAYEVLENSTIDLVLTDYRLPDHNGLEVMMHIKELNPIIQVIVMTAYNNTEEAVEFLQRGGDDYLVKPTDFKEIQHLSVRVFEKLSLEKENIEVSQHLEEQFETLPMIYGSPKMAEVLNIAARSARSNTTVLITGESGTGKEVIARLIHNSSNRKDRPFVTVNISALSEGLVESELFGHAKGAFTGAQSERKGYFEEAHGGTLFIDEVGDIPQSVQVKILRFLQFGEIQRVGENSTRSLDVRIIVATNRNLKQMVKDGTFRTDLYWRLNVITISIPPLRKRKEDILPLVEHFLEKFNRKNERSIEGLSREAIDVLMKRRFSGNVRELENLIEQATVLARGNKITADNIPPESELDEEQINTDQHATGSDSETESERKEAEEEIMQPLLNTTYDENMRTFERRLITQALEASDGNKSAAARLLGIGERKLRSRMEILDM